MGDKEATISLEDAKEDVVVLVFLANHCPVVTAYEDRIIDLANEFKGKSVKFIGVSVNRMESDRLPAIKERVKDKGYNYVYGFDESQKIGQAYGATVTPQFFVLDKDRVIRYTGALDDNQDESKVKKTYVKDAVNALLNGETIEVTETRAIGCGIRYERD
jgi:peroxiredoxin